MSRMAEPPLSNPCSFTRFILCLLIGCLAVHFLVEDAILFAKFAPLDPAAIGASPANYEEVEHLDDLVYAESLTGSTGDPIQSTVILVGMPCTRQASFPIFQPPKF